MNNQIAQDDADADHQENGCSAAAKADRLNNGGAGVEHLELEDIEGDSLQNEVSGAGSTQPREGSIQELIDKYQHFV